MSRSRELVQLAKASGQAVKRIFSGKVTEKTFAEMGSPSWGTPFDQIPPGFPDGWWQKNMRFPASDKCPTVSACIDAYSQTVATLGLSLFEYHADGGKQRITKGPIVDLIRKPNHYQTRSDLMLNLVRELLNGNAYCYLERNEYGNVVEIHQVQNQRIRPHIDPETREVWYAAGENPLLTKEIDTWVPDRNVLHVRLHTPFHPLVGVGPIENTALAISANQSIAASQAAFFANMSRPSGILLADLNMTKSQVTEARAAWREQSQGIAQGQVPILPGALKWEQLSLTSTDAQLVEAFKLSVHDIAKAFRVPLALIGEYENATLNNAETMVNQWLSTGLGFMIEHIEQALDRAFNLPPDQHFEFDVDTLLRMDFAGRIDALTKGLAGLYKPNEARAKEGLPPVENGDTVYVQAQVQPLGTPLNDSPPPPSPEEAKVLAFQYLKKAMNDG